jgi:hypothetical protein
MQPYSGNFALLLSIVSLSVLNSSLTYSSSVCPDGVACPIEIGSSSFDNSKYVSTAVGCQSTVSIKFASSNNAAPPPIVAMCERKPSGTCIQRPGVVLSDFQRNCCRLPYLVRPQNCTHPAQQDSPASIFQCAQLLSQTQSAATLVNVTLLAPYQSDLINDGQIEICLIARDAPQSSVPVWSIPYCIVFQVRRCTTCLSKGDSLSSLAHAVGTHWTQIYSANSHINDPDRVSEGEVCTEPCIP